ncbi:hypothetical protein GH714_028799 [Hevea brasiliensis]|uniref:Pectate lyase superfamily protein domain-containing protein n=1 Tax=Hevea brasiliensis TaxID=3981 RepID=A0A6A6MG54_HEVBR|nr:hypothetical protein GH714_028799 [Hevea brasiliensis]
MRKTEGREHLVVFEIFSIIVLVGSFSLRIGESKNVQVLKKDSKIDYSALNCRKHSALLTDFGGVGDGKTLNTKAFQSAIANLSQYASEGGAELIVPPGKWLTGSFNLTSHFTLFLHKGAVILASQVLMKFATYSNVVVQGVTILAPVEVPNTDGINPDSCTNVRIEDVYIVSGDDCIAVKSGWDQYGIKVGMPTQHLIIRRLTCISPDSATIALGSEMSGGLQDVRIEDITAINTESAVRIKTAPGRGGYIKDIFVRRMTLKNMKYVFWVSGAYKTHPDDGYDPNALAEIKNINYETL